MDVLAMFLQYLTFNIFIGVLILTTPVSSLRVRKVHCAGQCSEEILEQKSLFWGQQPAVCRELIVYTRQDKCSFNEVNWQIMGLLGIDQAQSWKNMQLVRQKSFVLINKNILVSCQ